MNGNDLLEFEEKNCERLQTEFKGDLESSEYWKFVEEEHDNI